MTGIIRPDYQAGAGLVDGAGTMNLRAGALTNVTRTGVGVYEISTSGIDAMENVVDATAVSSAVETISPNVEIVSDVLIRIRMVVNGALADRSFYINVNRVRNVTG